MAETGVTVVVADGFWVAVGETARAGFGDGVGEAEDDSVGDGEGATEGVAAASLGTGVPSSCTESHCGPVPGPGENGPTPRAALPPTPITPSEPTTSHAVRLIFIPVLLRGSAQLFHDE